MNATAYKVKKLLTRPVLKLVEGTPRHVIIQEKMFIGKEMKAQAGEKRKEPATIANVVDLDTGEEAQFIVSAVVKSVFNEEYPNDSYVGKAFRITKLPKQPGKQYNPFSVAELELPEAKSSKAAK